MHSYKSRVGGKVRVCVLLSAMLLPCYRAEAQPGMPFSSGSTGVDRALTITAPGVTYFNPTAMNLTKNTNIFNFTTITIAAGSTLKFYEAVFHGPVFLLASGDVTINGSIDITGDTSPGPTASGELQGAILKSRRHSKTGIAWRSSSGTDSTGSPAFFHARRPPLITTACTPFSSRKSATRALVASPVQVQ